MIPANDLCFIQNILMGFIIIDQIMKEQDTIEQKPVKMVIFNGPLSFNPNTLNNNILTFALAKKWQEKQRTYEDWIQLIQNLVQISKSLSDWAIRNFPQNKPLISMAGDMGLFNTWNVEGDGSVYVNFEARAIFDSELESPFKILKQHERFPVSSPPGHHKAVIADMDTDSQMMSKLFAFQLIMNNNLSLAFKPTSFTNITLKYLNQFGDQNMGADWWTKGSMKILSDKIKTYSEDVLNYFVQAAENCKVNGVQLNNNFQLRMNQSNYNQATKLSYINGYILQSQIDDGLSISHWRRILARKNEIGGNDFIYMKSIKKASGKNGVLFDFNSAIKAYVDQKTSKMAFDLFQLKISRCFAANKDGKYPKVNITLTPQQSMSHCGLYYVEGVTLIDRPAKSEIIVTVPDSKPVSYGQQHEYQYSFQIEERYKKTQFLYKDPNKYDIEAFEPFIEYKFRCTRFGKPIPSSKISDLQVLLKISLSPNGGIDSTGLSYAQSDDVIKMLQDALQDPIFQSEYESMDVIKQKWYLGSLPMITETAQGIQNRINSDNNWLNSKGKLFSPQFYQASQSINVQCLHSRQVKLDENGYGTFKIFLNENITRATNPRSLSNAHGNSIISSLCIQSLITPTIIDNSSQEENIFELYGDTTSGIYFESNPENGRRSADWKNFVGPRMRVMGLLYPAMQRIIDLYSFNEIHLGSMKRAFDIQSQLNSRYMPSTREISSFQHRMMRRWLYEPYYDHFNAATLDYNKIFKKIFPGKQVKSDFVTKKKVLRQLLKNAFSFELLTIPLYLNAMYGAPSTTIQKLIREISHDEMKHLFIASNLINSIREEGCQAEQNGPPYLDPKYVPHFPQKPLYAYESTDKYINNLYTFDIIPYGQDLLMKFIAAEFPGETQNLILSTQITVEGKQLSKEEENNIEKAKSKIEEISKMIAKVNQQKSKNEYFITVGQMYGQIIELLWQLTDQQDPQKGHILFSGNPIYQFTYPQLEHMTEIYSLRTALNQIRLIVQEGEGSRIFSVDNKLKKLSHFLKFIQAYVGFRVDEEKTNQQNNPYGNGYFTIYFKYDPNWVINDAPKNSWTAEQNKQLRKIVKEEESGLTPGGYEKYTNNISPNAFTNMYQKILMEFHYIFNSSYTRYKDYLNNDKKLKLSPGQYLSYFKNFKFKRMENAIAKMRNMSLLARYNVRLQNTPNFEAIPNKAKGNEGKSVQPGFNVTVKFPED